MYVKNKSLIIKVFAIPLIFVSPNTMAGTEIFPAEFIVLPAGTRLVSLLYFHRDFSGYYSNEKKVANGELLGQALVGVYTQYGTTFNKPSSWTISLPYVNAKQTGGNFPLGFGESAVGLSDVRFTYNFWPINAPNNAYSLAVSSNITAPTGRYNHDQALNAGDNRWLLSMQLGWVQKLSENLYWDFTPEWKRFSTNTDYVANLRLEQSDIYAVTSYLRWQPIAGWEFSGGFQVNRGGTQRINDFNLDNATNQERYFFAARKMLTPTIFTSVRYSQDSSVDNDVKIKSDWVLRLGVFF